MQTASHEQAGEFLVPLYNELRKLAHARIRRLRPGETLQTTDLVHEAYIRLSKNPDYEWQSPRHFFGAAALAMREILVDRARHRGARKRGGDQVRVDLITMPDQPAPLSAEAMLTLHTALERMQAASPDLAEVVHLHFFAGLPLPEIASTMGLSLRTIERRWRTARAWLSTNLEE
jgi:RNA polymerase sigma factor (TIGR02999 family)